MTGTGPDLLALEYAADMQACAAKCHAEVEHLRDRLANPGFDYLRAMTLRSIAKMQAGERAFGAKARAVMGVTHA